MFFSCLRIMKVFCLNKKKRFSLHCTSPKWVRMALSLFFFASVFWSCCHSTSNSKRGECCCSRLQLLCSTRVFVFLCRLRSTLLFIVYLSLFVRSSLRVFSVFVLLVYISARCVLRVDRQSISSTLSQISHGAVLLRTPPSYNYPAEASHSQSPMVCEFPSYPDGPFAGATIPESQKL